MIRQRSSNSMNDAKACGRMRGRWRWGAMTRSLPNAPQNLSLRNREIISHRRAVLCGVDGDAVSKTEGVRPMAKAALVPALAEHEPPAVSESAAIIQVIERAARDPSVNVEKMERLYAMHERAMAARA